MLKGTNVTVVREEFQVPSELRFSFRFRKLNTNLIL